MTTPPARAETPLLIAFVDLLRFAVQCTRVGDVEIAEVVDEYYERVAARVAAGGGQVVKFMGDGALVVFEEAAADRAVGALLDLRTEIDAWLAARGWECRLAARVHFGAVIAGPYGAAGAKRFDVIGRAVNDTARMPLRGVSLSADAYGKLGPALRERFQEHARPATYVAIEDAAQP